MAELLIIAQDRPFQTLDVIWFLKNIKKKEIDLGKPLSKRKDVSPHQVSGH